MRRYQVQGVSNLVMDPFYRMVAMQLRRYQVQIVRQLAMDSLYLCPRAQRSSRTSSTRGVRSTPGHWTASSSTVSTSRKSVSSPP